MRLLGGFFLLVAILALVLWLTAGAMAGISKVIALLFLVLFVITLFLRKGRAGKL